MANFGEIIKRLREEENLSQEQLAAKAALSRATVQNIEKSAERKVRGSTYRALAAALRKEPAEIDREFLNGAATEFPQDLLKQLNAHAKKEGVGAAEFLRAAMLAIYALPQAKRDLLLKRVTAPHRAGVFPALAASKKSGPDNEE